MRRLGFVLAAVAAALIGSAAQAQDYPNRTIQVVVPFAAGGAVDVLARLIGAKLTEQVGQTVIIENRPGAGGTLGADAVAKAAPDGYTILQNTNGARDRARALQEPAVRRRQGLRAGHPDHRFEPGAGDQSEIRHPLGQGADRAGQRASRASSTTDRAASAIRCT